MLEMYKKENPDMLYTLLILNTMEHGLQKCEPLSYKLILAPLIYYIDLSHFSKVTNIRIFQHHLPKDLFGPPLPYF